MKSIAKFVCCGVALAWMCSAAAEDDVANPAEVTETTAAAAGGAVPASPTGGSGSVLTQVAAGAAAPASTGGTANAVQADAGAAAPAAEDAKVVPTPPAPRIAVKPYHDKINRANVEKRIENNAAITQKRSAVVEKDAADRAAKAQQGQ